MSVGRLRCDLAEANGQKVANVTAWGIDEDAVGVCNRNDFS